MSKILFTASVNTVCRFRKWVNEIAGLSGQYVNFRWLTEDQINFIYEGDKAKILSAILANPLPCGIKVIKWHEETAMDQDVGNVVRYRLARKDGFHCALSLAKAIQDAGGTVPSAIELGKMTVEDFVTKIAAQNHIRFIFEKPDEN